MLLSESQIAAAEAGNLLGEWSALNEQLGSPEALDLIGAAALSLRLKGARDPARLDRFLRAYFLRVLAPLELPAIRLAYWHALRNETRELIDLDQSLSKQPFPGVFASASHRVGAAHLQRLKPLRDHRLVQRYLQAAETGEARAWHTLVYGVTLAVFSMPLRQGLCHYADQILRALGGTAARAHGLPEETLEVIVHRILEKVPATVESALGSGEADPLFARASSVQD